MASLKSRLSPLSLAAITLLLVVSPPATQRATGLWCYKCSSWDNVSMCSNVPTDKFKPQEECAVRKNKKSVCVIIAQDECIPMVYKNAEDAIGNGGLKMKMWRHHGCVYLDKGDRRYKDHKKCYWERLRGGPDLFHNRSGFQVIGRNSVKLTCYCSTSLCNADRADNGCNCGPACNQESRDQCETPGYDSETPEEFSKDCICPKQGEQPVVPNGTEEVKVIERAMPACGSDPNRVVLHRVGDGPDRVYRRLGEPDGGSGVVNRGHVCWNILAGLLVWAVVQ